MSHEHTLRCADCDVRCREILDSLFFGLGGADRLRDLVEDWPKIRQIQAIASEARSIDVVLSIRGCFPVLSGQFFAFLRSHEGHAIDLECRHNDILDPPVRLRDRSSSHPVELPTMSEAGEFTSGAGY
jgi:hypothetical protein